MTDPVLASPCAYCGMPINMTAERRCPHCGRAIVACYSCGGEVDLRIHALCPRCSADHDPRARGLSAPALSREAALADLAKLTGPVLIRTYTGRTQDEAAILFAVEAKVLAMHGYSPASQSWADGRPGLGRVITLGLFANSLRPDGTLTVTYRRTAASITATSAPENSETKICPDCAEEIKAAARVCRFCRYEFTDVLADG